MLVWRVAKNFGVSKKRVYQMVKEGKLSAAPVGSRPMRITRESYEKLKAVRDQESLYKEES